MNQFSWYTKIGKWYGQILALKLQALGLWPGFTKTHIQVKGSRLVKSARNSKIKNLDSPGTKRNATHKKILVLTNSLCSTWLNCQDCKPTFTREIYVRLARASMSQIFLAKDQYLPLKKKAGVDKAWSQKWSHCKPVHLG